MPPLIENDLDLVDTPVTDRVRAMLAAESRGVNHHK
jgi:hypothetical protein